MIHSNGYKYIAGEFDVGNGGLIDAPTKADGTKYDSVVQIMFKILKYLYIVFQDAVVYPAFTLDYFYIVR